jgi:hypothetical protein
LTPCSAAGGRVSCCSLAISCHSACTGSGRGGDVLFRASSFLEGYISNVLKVLIRSLWIAAISGPRASVGCSTSPACGCGVGCVTGTGTCTSHR